MTTRIILIIISSFLTFKAQGQNDTLKENYGTIKVKREIRKSFEVINGDTIYYDYKVKAYGIFSKWYLGSEIETDTLSYRHEILYDKKGRKRIEKFINVNKNRAKEGELYQDMDYLEHLGRMNYYHINGRIKKTGKFINELHCREFYFIIFQRPCREGKWTFYSRKGQIKKRKNYR